VNRKLRVGLACTAWESFDRAQAARSVATTRKGLSKLDIDLVEFPSLLESEDQAPTAVDWLSKERIDLLLLQIGTFAWGGFASALGRAFDGPFLLWGIPEPKTSGPLRLNSLCGVNLASSILHRYGRRYGYVYGRPNDAATLKKVTQVLDAASALKKLAGTRIALLEYRVPGFYGSTFDEVGLHERFGVEVRSMCLSEIETHIGKAGRKDIAAARALLSKKYATGKMKASELETIARVYVGFKNALDERGCAAVAAKCWPGVGARLGVRVCGVLGLLTDTGVIAGCEADMLGTVTMILQRELAGTTPFLVDLVAADRKKDIATFWHCGNMPPSLSDRRPRLEPSGIATGRAKSGAVTVARLSGLDGGRMLLATGEAVKSGAAYEGANACVRFPGILDILMDTIMYEGYEHHVSLVWKNIESELRLCAGMAGVELDEVKGGER
jgi:L-fucose isomerase-like protein